MAKSSKVAALNIGMQTVTMAVFEPAGAGSIALTAFASASLLADPAADSSREGQLRVLLAELKAKSGYDGRTAACAIPSQGVFTRFVSIPKIEQEKVGQMLHFEAQQNVPYPIEDVSWAYQVLPEQDESNLSALILATKLDQLEGLVKTIRSAGLSPSLIETSPVALYNAFRYNYPELSGCSLLIDIGARTTNLIFIEGDRLFIRTLPVGGASITAAMQKKFDGRAFGDVEDYKQAHGFIPPPGNYATGDDPDAAEAGKIARTVMTRVHNEITRSITFYRTSQRGSAPLRAFLAGGGASLPYTLEFFQEKLALPIEFFNPFRRVGVAASVDHEALGSSAHRLGECTGLALRALVGECPLEISLQSPSVEKEKAEERRRPMLAAAAALLVGAVALPAFYYSNRASKLEQEASEIKAQADQLDSFQKTIESATKQRKALLAEAATLRSAPLLRRAWGEMLDDLNSSLPERNIWITSLYPVVGGKALKPAASASKGGIAFTESAAGGPRGPEQRPAGRPAGGPPGGPRGAGENPANANAITALEVHGLYIDTGEENASAVVEKFVEQLGQSPLFRSSSGKVEIKTLTKKNPQDEGQWAYAYELSIPLAQPIPL